MLNKLEKEQLNCNIFSVYDYDGLSMQELLSKFFVKINECVETANTSLSFLEWLKEIGLKEEVALYLENMLLNGSFNNIINEVIFRDLNEKINLLNKKMRVISPEMFGAVGDGVADDLSAFNKMFEYMTTNAKTISVGGNEYLKDFGEYNILFGGKYAVSNTIIIPTCYNLKIENLYLTATNNFESDFLMKSTGTFRNSHFTNCIFDGNWWKASCFIIESSSLMNRFDNCQFRRFKYYGFKGGINTGHELIFSNCKISQYEWGDNDANIMPTTKGVGLYLPEQRGDNQIINTVFCYCLDSAIKLYASCTLINNCHVYSRNGIGTYAVEIYGGYNILSNNYFDYTTILLRGLNKVHNNMFISDVANFNFIVMDDTNENKWKYGTCQIIGNTFRSASEKITSPIIAKNFTLTKGTMSIYDNSFDNCNVVYCEPHYNYSPSPFREFPQTTLTKGYTEIGDIKLMWGTCTAGTQVVLECTEVLNVQLTLYQDTAINTEKLCASNVYQNKFTPSGVGYGFYFAVCKK